MPRKVYRSRLAILFVVLAIAAFGIIRFRSHAQGLRIPLQAPRVDTLEQTPASLVKSPLDDAFAQPQSEAPLVSPPSGQLWFITNANTQSLNVIAHVNNDNNNQVKVIDGTVLIPLDAASMSDVQIDPAANLYFFMKTNNLGVDAELYAGHLNSGALPTKVFFTPNSTDIVNTFQLDVYSHHLYLGYTEGTTGDENLSGIKDFTYSTTTGALTAVATNGGWLVKGNQVGAAIPVNGTTGTRILDTRDFALDHLTNKLFFTIELDSVNENAVYRLDLATPTTSVTKLSQPSQFPTNFSNGFLHTLAVDTSTGLVYFDTHPAHASPDATFNVALSKIYSIPETASGSTAATVVTLNGTGFPSANFYPTGIAFDQDARQLYVVDEKVDAGATPDNDDAMEVFQLSADGHTGTFQSQIQLSPNFNSGNANNYTSMTFDVLPVLAGTPSTLGTLATATHAPEQGAAITLLTGAPTISDIDGDHLASATVQITGGTFVANETSANDDHLTINGLSSGTSGNLAFSYNSATETMTITGFDTFANYQSILALVKYNTTGDNPTNYGNNTTRTLQWIISDGVPNVPFGSQNSGSTTLTIDAVNDSPANNLPASPTVNEDVLTTISGLTITDVDADPANQTLTTTFSVTNGTLTFSTSVVGGLVAGDITNNGTNSVTVTATQNKFANTFANVNGFRYKSVQDYFGPDTLHIVTGDNGHSPPPALGDTDDLSITVNPVNDVPSFTKGVDQTVNEDAGAQTVNGWATAISSGPANESSQVVNFIVTNNKNALFSSQPSISSTGVLTYTPATNANGTAIVTVQIHDDGGIANGGVDTSVAQTFNINVTAVNDAPTNTVPAVQTTNEDTAKVFSTGNGNLISIGDVDDADNAVLGDESLQVTLSATNGTMTLSSVVGLSFSFSDANGNGAGTGTADALMRFRGSLANINAALSGMSFTPTTNINGSASVSITTNDLGNFGTGGALSSAVNVVSINVTAVNDAPTNAVPGVQTTNEDTAKVFSTGNGNLISVTDVDDADNAVAGDEPVQVTLSASNGTMTLNGVTGLSFSFNDANGVGAGDGTADALMRFRGTILAINTALSGMTFTPDANVTGAASMTITTNDLGNFGSGGALSSAASAVSINVTAVNDAPTNTVPAGQTTPKNTAKIFNAANGNAISTGDVDDTDNAVAGDEPVQAELSVTNGTITLSSLAGLSFSFSDANGNGAGDGTADALMRFRGSLANINAALSGMSFTPTNNFTGPATLTIITNDLGNFGTGGTLTATSTVNIDVLAPTAATVAVSGRVASAAGFGVRGARVVIAGGNGVSLTAVTNAFGYYRFDTVQSGGTYSLSASARGYKFSPKVVSVTDQLTDVNLTALP